MFKKLKQKIEEEGVDLAKSPNSPQPRTRRDSGQSTSSRTSDGHDTPDSRNSGDIKMLLDKDVKIDEFSNSFNPTLLDGGPAFADRPRHKSENPSSASENRKHDKKLEELKAKVESLENERKDLASRLQKAELINEKYIQKQEDREEFEGFQTQEGAKVKHLLLLSQQELQISQTNVETKENELKSTSELLAMMRLELNGLKKEKESWLSEKLFMADEATRLGDLLADHSEAKSCLEKVTIEQLEQNKEMKVKFGQLEQAMSDLQDDRDALNHRHEILISKSSSQLEEKCNFIAFLEEKVNVLERRRAENNLGNDDRFQAVVRERDELEQKLEESRLHLTEIKSSWSEKITNLERQISHLNNKISEDSEESARLASETNLTLIQKDKELEIVNREIDKLRNAIAEHKQVVHLKDAEMKDLRVASKSELLLAQNVKEEACKHLEDKILAYENRLSALEAEKDAEISTLNNKTLQLELKHTERIAAENELQKTIVKLTEEKNQLKRDAQHLESEVDRLESLKQANEKEAENMKVEIVELNTTLEGRSKEFSNSRADVANREADLKSCNHEKDELMMRNAELSHQLEVCRQSNLEAQKSNEESAESNGRKIQELTADLTASETERNRLNQRISELESVADVGLETSQTLAKLTTTVSDLENQLTDKLKTIKLQQHRISDMKKTMQKELKLQSPYAATVDVPEVNDREVGTQVPVMGKVTTVQLNCGGIHQRHSSLADKLDDINFKYLKHVMLRYMTSAQFETPQLVKAIAVLLDFTPDEEQLVRETLDYKSSWFGTKPQMTRGTTLYRP